MAFIHLSIYLSIEATTASVPSTFLELALPSDTTPLHQPLMLVTHHRPVCVFDDAVCTQSRIPRSLFYFTPLLIRASANGI